MVLPSKPFQNFVVLEFRVLENVTNRWSQKEQGAPQNKNVVALVISCLKHLINSKWVLLLPTHCFLSNLFFSFY